MNKAIMVSLMSIGVYANSALATGEDCCQFPMDHDPQCTSDITFDNCEDMNGIPLMNKTCPEGGGQCMTKGLACCLGDGGCVDDTPIADCDAMGGQPLEEGDFCLGDENENGIDDACEANIIPTVSEWGLIVMTLLALTAGTIVFARRRRPAVA